MARVTLVERNAHGPFGRVVCQPLAGIERNTQLLILMTSPDIPPRPPAEDVKTGRKIAGKMAPIKDPVKEAAAAAAPATTTPAAKAPAAPAAKAPAGTVPAATPAAKPAAAPAAVPPKEATR